MTTKKEKKKDVKKWELAINLNVDKPKNKSNLKIIVTIDGEERIKSNTDIKGDDGIGLENMTGAIHHLLNLVQQDRAASQAYYAPDSSTVSWVSIEPVDLPMGKYYGVTDNDTIMMSTIKNKKRMVEGKIIEFKTNFQSNVIGERVVIEINDSGYAYVKWIISEK